MNPAMPHYLRVVRALSVAAGLASAAGCASAVVPGDGSTSDVAVVDRIDPTDSSTPVLDASPDAVGDATPDAGACPPTEPTLGTPCTSRNVLCQYDGGQPCGVTCSVNQPDGGATWSPSCVIGPLSPPELTASV